MTAVLQLEFDKRRHPGFVNSSLGNARCMAEEVLKDVLRQGGTMVLVVSKDKVTLVQRAEAEEIEEDEPHPAVTASEKT